MFNNAAFSFSRTIRAIFNRKHLFPGERWRRVGAWLRANFIGRGTDAYRNQIRAEGETLERR